MTPEQLVREALEAMHFAYVPYSGFTVGAALLTKSGKVYRGCNIENAAYGPSNCAERTAIFKAVSEGEREFAAIAVVGGKNGDASDIFPPCGVCRQVMQEFCAPDFMIYMGRSDGKPPRRGAPPPHSRRRPDPAVSRGHACAWLRKAGNSQSIRSNGRNRNMPIFECRALESAWRGHGARPYRSRARTRPYRWPAGPTDQACHGAATRGSADRRPGTVTADQRRRDLSAGPHHAQPLDEDAPAA